MTYPTTISRELPPSSFDRLPLPLRTARRAKPHGVLMPPLVNVGDVILVYTPDIGTWQVAEVLRDYKGFYYLRLKRDNGKTATIIAATGFEILVSGGWLG